MTSRMSLFRPHKRQCPTGPTGPSLEKRTARETLDEELGTGREWTEQQRILRSDYAPLGLDKIGETL